MVSNRVQSLEDRLGACLLNRTTRKLGLTEIGKANYERGTQILAELEDADRAAGALHSTPRGTLRLYTGASLARSRHRRSAVLEPEQRLEHGRRDSRLDFESPHLQP